MAQKSIDLLAETLQDAEVAILEVLKKQKKADIIQLEKLTGLKADVLARAALWLQNKGLIKVKEEPANVVVLDRLGEEYVLKGLPEKAFIRALVDRKLFPDEIARAADLDKQELKFCIGYTKQKGWVRFESDGRLSLTDEGKTYLKEKTLEEKFLEKLSKEKELEIAKLLPEEQHAFQVLKKRKEIVKEIPRKIRDYIITSLGLSVAEKLKKIPALVGVLTPEMIKTGSWRTKKFRRYDVSAPVPKIYIGKKQPYRAFLDEVKEELIAMGFEEMTGPLVEIAFFNNDALFMPQDHPARGIHDIYFVKEPKYGNLNPYKKFLNKVAEVQEKGGYESTGWQVPFSKQESARLLLRSQGTALSARMLMSPNLKIPGKYFAIARVYRPEKLDASHLVEFNQCEGIVLGENVNFRHLVSLLREFAIKIAGTDKVKITPIAYFPFTEPSAAGYVFHPKFKIWLEIFGAGIFRPEVTKPLGVEVPVLAWGIGIDRLFMIREGITDIRQLFSSDLSYLREAKV